MSKSLDTRRRRLTRRKHPACSTSTLPDARNTIIDRFLEGPDAMELGTAVRHKLPLLCVISLNDRQVRYLYSPRSIVCPRRRRPAPPY